MNEKRYLGVSSMMWRVFEDILYSYKHDYERIKHLQENKLEISKLEQAKIRAKYEGDLLNRFKSCTEDITKNYQVEIGLGAGRWTNVPYIAIMDKRITTSTKKGFYVVYLFESNMDRVYLSLNQGESGSLTKEQISEVKKKYMCKDFSTEIINLGATTQLTRGYENRHILGKSYEKFFLPSDYKMREELAGMLDIYRQTINDYKNYLEGISDNHLSNKAEGSRYKTNNSIEIEEDKRMKVDSIDNNRIFIVHGRNEVYKEKAARLLEKLDLEPIILHEQTNKSRTIIEKFESYSDVKYAIVLLTPDDEGKLTKTSSDLKGRARQNVIFELGYFIGKLGRDRVCSLYLDDVELPSDISGVTYIELDKTDAWKFNLAKELKEAGFRIDLNKV
ncbi:MAG: DUF3578 domain-containing protein [Clostridia bacterium]|nr:DUF3578 domain-containing protein [Clostridia bacterium]